MEDGTGFSQRSAYDTVYETLRAALTEVLAKGSKRLLATYLQTLLAYPDGCTRGETVFDPETEDVLVCHPRLVQTGLDLVEFPTICWYETDYSVYTMRQERRPPRLRDSGTPWSRTTPVPPPARPDVLSGAA